MKAMVSQANPQSETSFPRIVADQFLGYNSKVMAMTPDQIKGIASVSARKRNRLKWHFYQSKPVTGRAIRFLSDDSILVEKEGFWHSRAIVVRVDQVYSVMFI